MKSAYELAMERLNAASGPARKLSAAEKSAIADIDTKLDARAAETRLGYESRIAAAAAAEQGGIHDEMTAALRSIEDKREQEKARIWESPSD